MLGLRDPQVLEPEALSDLLELVKTEDYRGDHDYWLELMFACHAATHGEGVEEFARWCESDPEYAGIGDMVRYRWSTVSLDRADGVTWRTLHKHLREHAGPDAAAELWRAAREAERGSAADDFDDFEEEAPTGRRLSIGPFLTDHGLLAQRPPEWLSRWLLPRGGVGVLFGETGSLKSFVAFGMARDLAHGLPTLLDPPDTRREPVQVVYVAGEGGSGYRARMQAHLMARGLDPYDPPVVPFFMLQQPVMLNRADQMDRLAERILRLPEADHRLVVFDTLASCLDGDENSAQDVGAAIRNQYALRDRCGATVLAVHHSGYGDRGRERGSSGIRANVDSSVRLSNARKSGPNPSVDFQVMKMKDGADGWGGTIDLGWQHFEAPDGDGVLQPTRSLAVVGCSVRGERVEAPRERQRREPTPTEQQNLAVSEILAGAPSGTLREDLMRRVMDDLNVSDKTAISRLKGAVKQLSEDYRWETNPHRGNRISLVRLRGEPAAEDFEGADDD
jgi:hypothetical protein